MIKDCLDLMTYSELKFSLCERNLSPPSTEHTTSAPVISYVSLDWSDRYVACSECKIMFDAVSKCPPSANISPNRRATKQVS